MLLGIPACLCAQANQAFADGPRPGEADGILQSFENANLTAAGDHDLVTRKDRSVPVEMVFTRCQGLGVNREHDQWWVLPIGATGGRIDVNTNLWICR